MGAVSRRRVDIPAPRSGAVVPSAAAPVEDDLRTLYDRYRSVATRLAPDLTETPEVAYARAALIRALVEDGWRAPEVVLERLRADEALVRPRLVVAS